LIDSVIEKMVHAKLSTNYRLYINAFSWSTIDMQSAGPRTAADLNPQLSHTSAHRHDLQCRHSRLI